MSFKFKVETKLRTILFTTPRSDVVVTRKITNLGFEFTKLKT